MDEIKEALTALNITDLTEVQERSIPSALEGRDIIAQSQTGTGKTFAFAIPIIEQLDLSLKKPQAIVLCPTRELAVQVTSEISKLTNNMKEVRAVAVYGGEPIDRQISKLRKGAHVVVGTPGRMKDHLNRKTIRTDHVKFSVLDEADEMLNMGFFEEIQEILERLPKDRQSQLFSATMPKKIVQISNQFLVDPLHIKITRKEVTNKDIMQKYFEVREQHKIKALDRLIHYYQPTRSLIFCNTKRMVDELNNDLQALGYNCDKIHGDIPQQTRLNVLRSFNNGRIEIMIATDVAARGLDIGEVDAVFNYDVPTYEENYVHRVGRTGRAGKLGRSFTLVKPGENHKLRSIMRYIKKDIDKKVIPSSESINTLKVDRFSDELKTLIDKGNISNHEGALNKLVEDGYDLKDIALALMTQQIVFEKEENLNYEKSSRDRDRGHKGNRSGDRRDRGKKSRRNDKDFVRYYCNIGKNQKISPKDFFGAIANEVKVPGKQIGTIDLYDKYTFFEVHKDYDKAIIKKMNKVKIKGKSIRVERANK